MDCVLRGGATVSSCKEEVGDGVGIVEAGAFVGRMIAVVAGETRGGGATMLDFFLEVSNSSAASVTAAAASEAAATVAGRRGIVAAGSIFSAGSIFFVPDGGMTDVFV
jgi:hypothetical protein